MHFEMMRNTWRDKEEVSYYFSKSSFKFQGYICWKIDDFDPNWAFPECNSCLNMQMAMK